MKRDMQQRPIDIDIEVFRFLESKRASFSQTHNDILRAIAGLPPVGSQPLRLVDSDDASQAWTWKGVNLPHGTQLRMSYNGRTHLGEIRNGVWHVAGASYHTPSAAAGAVARSKKGRPVSLDGWNYWEFQLPGGGQWSSLWTLREKDTQGHTDTPREMDKPHALARFMRSLADVKLELDPSGDVTEKSYQVLYDAVVAYNIVEHLDWPKWAGSGEQLERKSTPAAIAQADSEYLANLATSLLRSSRYSSGAIEALIRKGTFRSIADRAAAVLAVARPSSSAKHSKTRAEDRSCVNQE